MDSFDEIEIVAREYLALGGFKCRWAIQRHLEEATASGDWNQIRKWYRVHIRTRQLARTAEPAAFYPRDVSTAESLSTTAHPF